jgi:hypothetical protein
MPTLDFTIHDDNLNFKPKVSFSSSENIMHAIRNYIFNVDHMKIADFLMMSPSNYQMAPHFWLYYYVLIGLTLQDMKQVTSVVSNITWGQELFRLVC